jgi:hypothetical protein
MARIVSGIVTVMSLCQVIGPSAYSIALGRGSSVCIDNMIAA